MQPTNRAGDWKESHVSLAAGGVDGVALQREIRRAGPDKRSAISKPVCMSCGAKGRGQTGWGGESIT